MNFLQTLIKKKIFLFLALLVLGGIFRSYQYFLFPIGGETADENAWTLLGASLIQEGVPASWSYFDAYKGYEYKTGIYDAPIVRPVFDHPPLFSLLPGVFHSIKAQWWEYPSLKVIRLPMVLLGILNVGLFWLVAQRFFANSRWAIISTLLFITIPEIVFGSRLVVAENLLITWTLLVLLGLLSPREKWSFPVLFGASLCAVLTKVSGGVLPLSLVVLGMMHQEKSWIKAGFWGGLTGVALFCWYGFVYNWQLFVKVLFAQSNRLLGLSTLQNRVFLHPTLVKHIFFDGWKILGLFSVFSLFFEKDKKYSFVQVLTITHLLFIFLTVGESTFHGWYDYVLWPTLILAVTAVLQKIEEKKAFLGLGLIWLLLLPTFRLALVFLNLSPSQMALRSFILAGFLPFVLESGTPKLFQKLLSFIQPTILVLLLGSIFLAHTAIVFFLTQEAYWVQASFFELP